MHTLLMIVAILFLLAVLVRFVWVLDRGAGVLTAGWESAGWMTLALIGSVVYASSGIDAEVKKAAEIAQSHVVILTELHAAAMPDEPEEPQAYVKSETSKSVIPISRPIPKHSTSQEQEPAPATLSQERMSRREMLADLHTETIEKFVKSPGFGFERRIRIRIDEFETPEKNRLYLPRYAQLASRATTREIPLPDRSHWKFPAGTAGGQQELQQLAQKLRRKRGTTQENPAETEADREQTEPRFVESEPEWDEWEVSDWELVSILKNDPPAAYASRNLKMMHRPRQAATRVLDQLEKGALAKLRKGETLVVANGINAIRMVGAVRAAASCLQCHKKKAEGDLLGAFTYELHRSHPIAFAAKIRE